MRSLIRTGSLVFLVAMAAALATPSMVFAGGETPWSFEVRASLINPVTDDGDYVSALNSNRTGSFDLLKSIVPELAVSYRTTERFAIEVSALLANMDMELDSPGAGELAFGDSDLKMFSLTGLFDVYDLRGTSLRFGLSFGYADFDDFDITPAAEAAGRRSGVQLTRAPGDSASLYGIVVRFDTPFGREGWYFSSSLRYLKGGPDLVVEGHPLVPTKADAPVLSGSLDFDPLVISFGIGYQY